MAKPETVFARDGFGLAGKAQFVQDRVHKVAGAIAGERPPGTVSPVRPRRQAKDQHTGSGISEAGDGTGPVRLVLIGAAAGFADTAAVLAKTGTKLAIDDGFADLLQKRRQQTDIGTSHCLS
jgi:hypothetical protein